MTSASLLVLVFVKNRIICPWFLADRPVFVQAQMDIFKGRSTTQADAYTKAELKQLIDDVTVTMWLATAQLQRSGAFDV